jgi:dolichol-phosphate mannosyltransferase
MDFFFKVGSFISFAGFVLGMIILIGKMLGKSPFNGFTLIACSILFIGGIQIMLTGLIGQYIARIYDTSRGKPAFHIERILQ